MGQITFFSDRQVSSHQKLMSDDVFQLLMDKICYSATLNFRLVNLDFLLKSNLDLVLKETTLFHWTKFTFQIT